VNLDALVEQTRTGLVLPEELTAAEVAEVLAFRLNTGASGFVATANILEQARTAEIR